MGFLQTRRSEGHLFNLEIEQRTIERKEWVRNEWVAYSVSAVAVFVRAHVSKSD